MKIGKIISVKPHPERDNLLVSQINVGESTGPRQIVSGLAKHISPNELEGKWVVVVTNLKPSKFAGVVSSGMVLAVSSASSNNESEKIEVLEVKGANLDDLIPGDVLLLENHQVPSSDILNSKHKIWEKVSVDLSLVEGEETDGDVENMVLAFKGLGFKSQTGGYSVGPATLRCGKVG